MHACDVGCVHLWSYNELGFTNPSVFLNVAILKRSIITVTKEIHKTKVCTNNFLKHIIHKIYLTKGHMHNIAGIIG